MLSAYPLLLSLLRLLYPCCHACDNLCSSCRWVSHRKPVKSLCACGELKGTQTPSHHLAPASQLKAPPPPLYCHCKSTKKNRATTPIKLRLTSLNRSSENPCQCFTQSAISSSCTNTHAFSPCAWTDTTNKCTRGGTANTRQVRAVGHCLLLLCLPS